MENIIDNIEHWARAIGAGSGLTTLAIALISMFKSLRRPAGRTEKGARYALRIPVLTIAAILFFLAGFFLWHSIPFEFPPWLRIILVFFGGAIYFFGLILYLWGLFSLGRMFAPSSGFGVRLHAGHRLITSGPYALIRHPMYLAVILAANGSFILYRTWASLVFAVIMFGLIFRARREEKVLSEEFGDSWKYYSSSVSAWLPRFKAKIMRYKSTNSRRH